MAFNIKVSVVLLVMLVVATSADARADLSEVFVEPESAGTYCIECECKKVTGTTKCYRSEWMASAVLQRYPKVCSKFKTGELITSTCKPGNKICGCTFEVDTCTIGQCPLNTAPKLEDLLSLNRNY